MKESEVLKHLDRAFTDMPSRLPDQIEMTFKRGEREMKRRYKLMTTLAVAAALAVLFAAIALAAGTLVKPRVDSVVASRGRGDGGSVRLPELTPMPTLLGKADGEATAARPTFTPPPQMMYEDDTVFYATEQGRYFHADEHCSGMMNAWPMNIDAAWISRKGPCPVCLDESAVPPIWFYYTEKGRYIHIYADCSGMKDARRATPGTLRPSDKQPCPACMPGGFALCWATPGGQYFHTERECMGMHTARIYTEVWAEWIMGKTPCPVCRLDQGNAELQLSSRMAVEPVIADVPDAVQLFRRAFGCELTALWPGSEILTTRRNPVDGDWECLLKQKGNGDSGFAAAVLSTRVVEDADGTGHDRRGEASTPANFVEGDLRMKLWQTDSKTLASLLRQAPEPLRSMATEAGTRLQSMPDLTGQASADRLAWVYLCFDESRTVIKAVDLFVYDPDDVHFQWMRNGQGGYDLAFVAVNGEK